MPELPQGNSSQSPLCVGEGFMPELPQRRPSLQSPLSPGEGFMPALPHGRPSSHPDQDEHQDVLDTTNSLPSLADHSETFKQLLASVSAQYDRLHVQAVMLTTSNGALRNQLSDLGVAEDDDKLNAHTSELKLEVPMDSETLKVAKLGETPSSPSKRTKDWEEFTRQTSGMSGASGPLEVHSVWKLGHSVKKVAKGATEGTDFEKLLKNDFTSGEAVRGSSVIGRCVIHPSAPMRLIWDVFTIVILTYDIFMVPYQVFDPPHTALLSIIECVSTIFWTLDVVFQFTTGFYKDSLVEMRPSKIALRYAKSWFIFDIIVLTGDWLTLLGRSAIEGLEGLQLARIGKSLRLMRVLRSLRLLRIVKLSALLTEVMDNIKSEYLRKLLDVFGLVICLVVFSHFIACAWYIVGDLQTSPGSWVNRSKINEVGDVFYRYVASLHWALSQFALTSMDVFAGSTSERVFAILVLLLALVFFSSFVSSITTSMGVILRLNRDAKNQQMNLRQYFVDNKISAYLANRIMFFLKAKHYAKRHQVHERDLSVLKLLPEALLAQLHAEVFLPGVIVHPFFWQLKTLDWVGICEMTHHAMCEHPLESREVLFNPNNTGTKMFFVTSGELGYYRDLHEVMVKCNQWISEGTLWMKWFHCGKAFAASSCELVELDSEKFQRVVMNRPRTTMQPARRYAKQYLFQTSEKCEILSDLAFEFDVLQEMAQLAFHDPEPESPGLDNPSSPSLQHSTISRSSQASLGRHRTIDPNRAKIPIWSSFTVFSGSSLGSAIWQKASMPRVRGRLRWML